VKRWKVHAVYTVTRKITSFVGAETDEEAMEKVMSDIYSQEGDNASFAAVEVHVDE